jgi:hypothetical protein
MVSYEEDDEPHEFMRGLLVALREDAEANRRAAEQAAQVLLAAQAELVKQAELAEAKAKEEAAAATAAAAATNEFGFGAPSGLDGAADSVWEKPVTQTGGSAASRRMRGGLVAGALLVACNLIAGTGNRRRG